MPIIQIVEDVSLTAADTASNTTIYNPPLGTTSFEAPSLFIVKACRVAFFNGSGTSYRALAVLRKVPNGYSFPAITVTSGLTTFGDFPNVLGYGLVNVGVQGTLPDPMTRIDMEFLKTSIVVAPGDTIALQVVINTATTTNTYSAELEYYIGM